VKDLTTAQLAELRENYDKFDSDGDGWIVQKEFHRLLQMLDTDLSSDECLLAFDSTDEDGDGSISFEEFMKWWIEA
jgi:Ca2+-binding EF-hand superfamily protein